MPGALTPSTGALSPPATWTTSTATRDGAMGAGIRSVSAACATGAAAASMAAPATTAVSLFACIPVSPSR